MKLARARSPREEGRKRRETIVERKRRRILRRLRGLGYV